MKSSSESSKAYLKLQKKLIINYKNGGIHNYVYTVFQHIGICVKLWTQETVCARLLECDTGEAARFFFNILVN